MVVKIMSGKDVKGAINYNEQKVQQGMAACIQASLFWKEPGQLNFHEKLKRFTELNERNPRASTNTIHISLNFSPMEQLSVDKLNAIASTYMQKIGFGDQPFLVYEHRDAAHQHVHIVSTLIRSDGKRIEIHNMGRNQSEKARKEIEKQFNLIPANKRQVDSITDQAMIAKVTYGAAPTFKSISNIVRHVTRGYKYTSLPELNAALGQFNVTAYRGSEKSQMFAKGGLLYWITDEKGNKVGVPVKASRIYGKPMLKALERQFKINEALRVPHKETLRAAIEKVLSFKIKDRDHFIRELSKHDIQAIFRSNADGRVYGLTFVDNRTRCVFKGSDLGKPYSASAIQERFGIVPLYPGTIQPKSVEKAAQVEPIQNAGGKPATIPKSQSNDNIHTLPEDTSTIGNMIEDLFQARTDNGAGNVRRKKKRKHRRPDH